MLTTGSAYPIAFDVYDIDGSGNKILANAVTVAASVTLPDGTIQPITIPNPPATTGKYRYTYLVTQEGHHEWRATTTVPNTDWGDSFNARDYHSIIGLAEAKAHLNMTATADDDELRNFLQAATELVEAKAGACVRRTVTERVSEGGYQLVLSRRPVISVESVKSVWPSGPGWTTAQLLLDGEAGIVHQTYMWMFWHGPWDVSYTIGRAVMPERYIHAAKEQVRHLWETQRGAVQAPPLAGEEVFTTSAGFSFSVPRRVLELIADDAVPAI
jgi:hypothetical protein